MIDQIYKTLLTIINKENQGYISPTEFNLLAANTQAQIFREYFEDEARDKYRENRGMLNKGYANLDFIQRQRVQQFAEITTVSKADNIFTLPSDLYLIEDDGILSANPTGQTGKVIEEVERNQINYQRNSEAAPTGLYPIYEKFSNYIRVYPELIERIELRYLRNPKNPKWTYIVVGGKEIYDPTNSSFQDFELHESELPNIILRMLTYFGINLREVEVVQIAEQMKDKMNLKENN